MPAMTATGVRRTWNDSDNRPAFLSGPNSKPSVPRMKFHCTVRITNETKNGTRISMNSVDFHRPP
jgi:hypothetical protein